jgi:hypothetical protein
MAGIYFRSEGLTERCPMKRMKAVVSTTHVDSQGERMSREAIESLAESFSRSYIPVGVEHDPRIPPRGRISSGFVRERPDGEYEAIAIMELFDGEDESESASDLRELAIMAHESAGLTVSYDWTHRFEQDQSDIREIAKVFGTAPVYDLKKAADPISIITIAGAFVLGGIATGFLGQIGIDGWNLVKKKLTDLFSRTENRKGEQLLVFSALVKSNSVHVEVETVLTNPTPQDVDRFLASGLQVLDEVLPIYLQESPELRRLVFEAKGECIDLNYTVRKDGRPLSPRVGTREILRRHRDE